MFLRALGFKTKPSVQQLRARMPAVHAFVELSVLNGEGGQVCIDEIGPKSITVSALPSLAIGSVGVFVYANALGKFRFSAKCLGVRASQAIFALPARVEILAKTSGGGAQKRSTVRIDTTLSAQWRYAPAGKGNGEFARGSVTDLSRSGASLLIDRELSKGTQVEVRFTLNSASAPLIFLGEVMRTSKIEKSGKNSLGLRFHGVSNADDRAIMEFINKRQAERRSRGLA